MGADRHTMPTETFIALARGKGGPSAVRTLTAGQHSRNLLTLRELVDRCADLGHPHADSVGRAWRLLSGLRRVEPAAVRRILTYPSVSAWAAETITRLDRPGHTGAPEPADGPPWPAMLSVIVAAAARYAGTPLTVDFPTPPGGAFPLPMIGHLRLDPDPPSMVELAVTGHGLTVDGRPPRRVSAAADGEGTGSTWWPVPRLRAGRRLEVRLDDLWSLARPGATPPVRPDEAARWRVALAPAWRLLATHHREYAAELAAAISMVMPLPPEPTALTGGGTAAEQRAALISGTFPTGVGCVALSGAGDAATTAATLVHELAHNKLAALDDLFPLVRPGADVRFPAPWRVGPRPVPALLQGLYAHVCVAGFWRRQAHLETRPTGVRRARAEFGRLRTACRDVVELLLTGDRLTPPGRLLVRHLHATLTAW
ncbi:aKG-HExxH-type peptide beta-hydroxylase [Micromonospora cathayae]|uniref:HEXXH motif-containing putative peptide modification protein n=1 Tax=Micromonospora cathayae TaxID=3028804 RepID=A0ABY7ZYG5_9ACTN|nr:HEXXH motif-containing putative peptide modification protein [Micromonospora sp. HUAS 3]WDZ86924.1 HEXXH motif-containing putative peptide modification protein [Micromonospora sp. HUAS 3]